MNVDVQARDFSPLLIAFIEAPPGAFLSLLLVSGNGTITISLQYGIAVLISAYGYKRVNASFQILLV